mgnify:CR=1 FL=1
MEHLINWNTFAAIATALGVLVGANQMRQNGKLAQSAFEDTLDQQYRNLSMEIPVDALIGKDVSQSQKDKTRECIYNYLDLSNEQCFIRKKGRVTPDTWNDWCTGIKANLGKPAFKVVWDEVKSEAPGTFSFLEKLENLDFNSDPRTWAKVTFFSRYFRNEK